MSMNREELTAIVHAAVDEALTDALETYVQAALAAQRQKLAAAIVPILQRDRQVFLESHTIAGNIDSLSPDEHAELDIYNAAIALLGGQSQ